MTAARPVGSASVAIDLASTGPASSQPASRMSRAEMLRHAWAARLTRFFHWEYWPSWVVYAPLVPWLIWLAIRYRGFTTFTAANPGIPLGGVAGESKFDILSKLPQGSIVQSVLIERGTLDDRRARVLDAMSGGGGGAWSFPIILKPDVGERGAGVRLIRSVAQIDDYLRDHHGPIVAQQFDPGPFEAGVFYVREPGQSRGQLLSITDKRFSVVVGDGRSSIRALIWRHPRFRAQAGVFLTRLGSAAERVPARGETVPLGTAGNHCQGTMFLDGKRLITPALTAAFDRIADHFHGFAFGRFDVRYADERELVAGRGFRIVELNGVLSESTNIYDPATGFWAAQRTLREQWRLAFAIGAANRCRMAHVPTLRELLRAILAHTRRPDRDRRAD